MVVVDVECYTNYFLAAFRDRASGLVHRIAMHNDSKMKRAGIYNMMQKHTTISFNGSGYDLYMLAHAWNGANNQQLKNLSDEIIKSNLPSYRVAADFRVRVPADWDHIDIMEVAPGQASLKIYGGRLGAQKLQDLPFDISTILTAEQAQVVADYCGNDLSTTQMLFDEVEKAIDLRVLMSDEYGVDLRSKSDAQIAEAVISRELERITGMRPSRPDVPDDTTFFYRDPSIVTFQTQPLQDMLTTVLSTEFTLGLNGSVKLPPEVREPVTVGDRKYQMGIGGLHSMESRQFIERKQGEALLELDVASFYPSIILQQRLAPGSLGVPFLKVYQSLVTRRLNAKAAGDKVTADTLKIVINGSFGKLGSKWSALYAPELLIQTTLTGQLTLLMLIESLHLAGMDVVSANTDGIVIHTSSDNEQALDEVAFNWEMATSYELERTDYNLIASRDVNNYMAIMESGKIKGKGVFATPGLAKNPDRRIVTEAVMAFFSQGKSIEDTIRDCTDITKFVTVRKVGGGAVWRGEPLGRAVRFYTSSAVPDSDAIVYQKSGNMVPKSSGAMPLMDLPDTFPDDVDYQSYIVDAEKLLAEVGYT